MIVPIFLRFLILNNNLTATTGKVEQIRVYVGSDKKIHFVNSAGADTVLPFNSEIPLTIQVNHYRNNNLYHTDLYINGAKIKSDSSDNINHNLACSYVAKA